MESAAINSYLRDCHVAVLDQIRQIVPPDDDGTGGLYHLMLDYPMRPAKGLRPTLAIATCRALGGHLDAILPTAAVLELYHNAFLIHDDVEDGSEMRRQQPTLHSLHGVPIAVNVGDAMLALTLQPLLDNMSHIGMGKALRVLQSISDMARLSAEGQAMELSWIRHGAFQLDDADYLHMVEKKTAYYSFATPMELGALIANAPATVQQTLRRFALRLGVGFQIRDDVLNLLPDHGGYGKEFAGDLWEGKHTLILIHTVRCATATERNRLHSILRKPRPRDLPETQVVLQEQLQALVALLGEVHDDGHETRRPEVVRACSAALRTCNQLLVDSTCKSKQPADIDFIMKLMNKYDSIEYANAVARTIVNEAFELLEKLHTHIPESVHRRFLVGFTDYVLSREK